MFTSTFEKLLVMVTQDFLNTSKDSRIRGYKDSSEQQPHRTWSFGVTLKGDKEFALKDSNAKAVVDIDEQMLPYCSPEDIDQQVKEIVGKIATPQGGVMLYAEPSHDVSLENVEALMTAWEEHCFYNWP